MAIEGTLTYDNLIAGDFPLVTDRQVLEAGQVLVRGAALGKVSSTGELKALDSGAGDGSQTPYAILAADADSSAGGTAAVYAEIYLSGSFGEDHVVFASGDTPALFKDAFRGIGIYLKATQGA